jgi:tetratricopeptide (TPR) repeat protein
MKKTIHFPRKLLMAAFILACIFLIIGIPSVYSQEKQPDPCTLGDLYLQAGQLDKAEETYATLLEKNPQEYCAIKGMKAVNNQRKALLKTYMDTGDYEKARDLTIIILSQSEVDESMVEDYRIILTKVVTTQKISNTPVPTPDAYSVIEGYFKLGRPDLAYSRIQTAIIENQNFFSPTLTPIPTDAEEIKNEEPTIDRSIELLIPKGENLLSKAWPTWLLESLKAYFIPLIIMIASGGILYLVVKMFIQVFLDHQNIKFDVGEFTSSLTKDEKYEVSIQSLIEREIILYMNNKFQDKKFGIDRPTNLAKEITSETTVLPKDIFFLINWINKMFPPRVMTLFGVLHSSTYKGAGITLRLVDYKNNLIGEYTVWQEKYDPTFNYENNQTKIDNYLCLIKPAAIWSFRYIINDYLSDFQNRKSEKKLLFAFGTVDLDSAISNYIAKDNFEKDPVDNQKISLAFLRDSLKYDYCNIQALFNLAYIKFFISTKEINEEILNLNKGLSNYQVGKNSIEITRIISKYYEAISIFMRVINIYRDKFKDQSINDIYYLSLYYLAMIFKYIYIFNGYDDDAIFPNSDLLASIFYYKFIKKIPIINISITCFRKAQMCISKEKRVPKNIIEDMDFEYKATCNLKRYDPEINYDIPSIVESNDSVSQWDKAYNLGSYYALMAGKLWNRITNINHLEIVGKYMHKAQEYLTFMQDYIEITDIEIYNLTKKTLASIDPNLYPLRTWIIKPVEINKIYNINKKGRARETDEQILWKEQLTPIDLPINSFPQNINAIFGISQSQINRLVSIEGLESTSDLLLLGADPLGRQKIREKTNISLRKICDWVRQADLMRIPWIDGKIATLLIRSGVTSIKRMKDIDDLKLAEELIEVNSRLNLTNKLPNQANLKDWIKYAQDLSIIIGIE